MSKHSDQKVYEFGEFRLEAAHLMLYRNGNELDLAPKAVETLLALVERNGEVVGKEELMETIWKGSIVEESNLSQYLYALRNALGTSAGDKPYIETLRRRGYRFSANVTSSPSRGKDGRPSIFPADFCLIGRETEIAQIIDLLSRDDVKLLTLTGVGGAGKTTLARAVAEKWSGEYGSEAIFVELAAANRQEVVLSAIASALGIKEGSGESILNRIGEYLQNRPTLVVLDNFEQVVSAAPTISELIGHARELKVLVTSRILLRLRAETEFAVPPLTVSGGGNGDPIRSDAVNLFIDRASSARPGLELTDENLSCITEICARLDGLPLAIELAAARTKLMTPDAMLSRLQKKLDLLIGGARDAPVRQQTMRGTIAWSFDLLDGDEKRLFARLAVFSGGFDLEAAEAVCSGNDFSILNGVDSLVEQNLLGTRTMEDGGVRFRMLEVVREFADEMLAETGEKIAMAGRHAEYYLTLGEAAEPRLQAARSPEWLNRLEADHDNLRTTLQWSLENDPSIGQRLSGAIWRFWWLHGHIREGCEQLDAFLAQSGADGPIRAKMLSGAGALNRLSGNLELSRMYAEEGAELARATDDHKNGALSLHQLGFLAIDDSHFDDAERFFNEGLQLAESLGDKQVLGLLHNGLGELSRMKGNLEIAAEFYAKALQFNRDAGDRVRQTTCLINLGATALLQDDLDAAGNYYLDGLEISSKSSDMNGTIYCLEGVAGTHWAGRDPRIAVRLYGAADEMRKINSLFLEAADRLPYERSVSRVRDSLEPDEFEELFAEGRRMKLTDAAALALSNSDLEFSSKQRGTV